MINKRCAALVMAAIMAASSAMPVMAEVWVDGNEVASGSTVGTVTTENEDSYAGVEVDDGSSVTVNGDVDAKEYAGDGVSASGEGSSASVSGNVSSVEGSGVYAEGGSSVTVGGNVSSAENNGITVSDGGLVSVGGNVSANSNVSTGIDAEDSTVTVKGDVISKGDGIYAGAGTYDEDYKTTVDVKGNVTAEGSGIFASGNTTVTVGGDVTSKDGEHGIEGDNGADIVVGGNITASGDGSVGIELDSGSSATVGGSVKGDDGAFVIGSKLHVKGDVISKSGVTVGVYGTDKTTCIIEGDV